MKIYSEKKPPLFCPNNNYSIEDHSVALELWGYFLQKKVCKSKVVSRSSTNAQKSTTKNMGKAGEPFFLTFERGSESVERKRPHHRPWVYMAISTTETQNVLTRFSIVLISANELIYLKMKPRWKNIFFSQFWKGK